ncbi:putative zinc-binding metallopeptidase [Fulvivirga maritima]|uniref:zinc-binding metallopeptidase n=1 Tax=Fulvivirga maritima TaxID=2904247 RepID=UPI001F27176E|nr:putative zinc-binding metallopeptidase [Fulvivirga maritima]UII27178.1 putative zinc-binding metallopeptidase [Fulvivirga maritima]
MTFRKYIIYIAVILAAVACDDPYNDSVNEDAEYVNNDEQTEPTELDNWLQTNFTSPFNIEVKYKWDLSELNVNKTLVPPDAGRVQGVMEVVRKVWIDPYVELAGDGFIKDYSPKQFMLVGSPEYNFDGTIKLGTAEGGRKVVLYVVNSFEQTNQYSVKQLIHTIEHEFGHILHQTNSYPAEYKEITPGDYTANWNFVSLAEARSSGFITSYAMMSPDEDFVEMIAMMLVEGKDAYEAILECETNAASKAILRRKEELVVKYFAETYNVDFYALQDKVQAAINEMAPDGGNNGGDEEPAPLQEQWGPNEEYTTLYYDLSTLAEPEDIIERHTYDNNLLHQYGYALDYNFKLYYSAVGELTLTLYYHTINTTNPEYYEANFWFNVPEGQEEETRSLYYMGGDTNASFLEYDVQSTAVVAYFANRTFKQAWEKTCNGNYYPTLYPQDSPEDFIIGILGN